MNWNKKKVVVTGAAGFIGSHLSERLVELGAEVTALVRYNSRGSYGFLEDFSQETKDKIKVVLGDIMDRSTFRVLLKDAEVVFHLAAIPGIPYSFRCPIPVFEVNANGSLNLLCVAKEYKPSKIILASTGETYGDSQYLPIDEKHPQVPKSPYAASKAAMEMAAWSAYYADDIPVSVVRLFNNYGPRQSARAITPTIITQMLSSDELKIGSLYPKRDFTFVLDTVEAFIKVAELSESGEVYQIGSCISISVQEIIDTVSKILGKKVKIVTDEARIRPGRSEVGALKADYTRLKNATGWEPKVSYEEGLKITIEWMKQHLDQYKPEVYNI